MSRNAQFAKYHSHVNFPIPEAGKLNIYFPYSLAAWVLEQFSLRETRFQNACPFSSYAQLWMHLVFLHLHLQRSQCSDSSLVEVARSGIGRGEFILLTWSVADNHWFQNWPQQWLPDCGGFLFETTVVWLLRGQLPGCETIKKADATQSPAPRSGVRGCS